MSPGQPRAIGPIGRLARTVTGILFIAGPIASSGIDWWDVAAVLFVLRVIVVGATVLVDAAIGKLANSPSIGGQLASWCAVMAIVLWVALTFVSPFDRPLPVLVFFGLSMLLAARPSLEGCKIAAIPYLVLGHRRRLWLPPVHTGRRRPEPHSTRISSGPGLIDPAAGLVWEVGFPVRAQGEGGGRWPSSGCRPVGR